MLLPDKEGIGYIVFTIKGIDGVCFVRYWEDMFALDDLKNKEKYTLFKRHEQYPYYWCIEGRDYFRGFVAIAIAKLTEGFIDSGDGGWDINMLPAFADTFFEYYNNPQGCIDKEDRKWFMRLKQDFIDRLS